LFTDMPQMGSIAVWAAVSGFACGGAAVSAAVAALGGDEAAPELAPETLDVGSPG
jgi:hypothetical protein